MPPDQPNLDNCLLEVPSQVITDVAKLAIETNCYNAMQGSSISHCATPCYQK